MERHPEGTRLLIRWGELLNNTHSIIQSPPKAAPPSLLVSPPAKLAGEEGFEPSLHDPESCVLPLDDSPVPSKIAAEIGQKIQSLLSNPPLSNQSICNQSIAELILKDQTARRDPAGLLLASSTRARVYNEVTDNGNETIPLTARQRNPSFTPLTRQSDMRPHQRCRNPLLEAASC